MALPADLPADLPAHLPPHVDGAVIADWVARMVRIPSVNPLHAGPRSGPGGERDFALALGGWLADLGATEVELDDVVDGRPNLYALVPGRTGRVVVLDAHLDTVTVENMTDPPFDGRIEDGCVWGRGSLDTKASLGIICALMDSWAEQGLRPEPTLLVVGTVGEEAGGLPGATAFRRWVEGRGLVIDQMVVSEPTGCRPVHGHKGAIGLRVTVHGESAHSATPERGRNAVFAAAHVIGALEDLSHELVAGPAGTALGTGTLLVSMVQGGVAPNVVPDRCELVVGRRLVPGEDPASEFARIEAVARAASPLPVTVEPLLRMPDGSLGSPAFYQDPTSSLVSVLAAGAGTSPATAPFGTNALRYGGLARETCVFGPGDIENAHKATECVGLADLERAARALQGWLRAA